MKWIGPTEKRSKYFERVDRVELTEFVVRPITLTRSSNCSFGVAEPIVRGSFFGITEHIISFRDFLQQIFLFCVELAAGVMLEIIWVKFAPTI